MKRKAKVLLYVIIPFIALSLISADTIRHYNDADRFVYKYDTLYFTQRSVNGGCIVALFPRIDMRLITTSITDHQDSIMKYQDEILKHINYDHARK